MSLPVLEQIAETSQEYNKSKKISGMLLGIENKYLQYLEGEEEEVKTLYDKIRGDGRHFDVIAWVKGYSKERVFKDWSMGSWMLPNEYLEKLPALSDLKDFLRKPQNDQLHSKKFISMMDGLLSSWIAHEPERAERMKEKNQ